MSSSGGSSGGSHHSGSSPMAGVFLFSIMTLTLIPYTIYAVKYREPPPEPELELWKQKAAKSKAKKEGKEAEPAKPLAQRIKENMSFHNVVVALLWLGYVALFVYVLFAFQDNKPFDPFEILGVDRSATPADIRRAWRKLSLQYHPDKNPDKNAEKYFTEFISKAYKTLTDETARKNWEEYGHPDGPQGLNIGVAMPEWLFTNDKKRQPIVLLGVLFVGFVLPIVSVLRYLDRDEQRHQPKVMKGKKASDEAVRGTMSGYYHHGFKPTSNTTKVLEMFTLSAIMLEKFPVTRDQVEAVNGLLRKLAAEHPEIKSDDFKRRKGELTKCHLMLLCHLDRKAHLIPPELAKEYPIFLEEVLPHLDILLMVCHAPRALDGRQVTEDGPQPPHLNWWVPYEASVDLSQCIFQAVHPANFKIMAGGRKEAKEGGDFALLQLPGVTVDVARKLAKQEKVKGVRDLMAMPLAERQAKLMAAGAPLDRLDEVELMLDMLPEVHMAVAVRGPGPKGEIYEAKPFIVLVQTVLTRRVHAERRREGRDLLGRPLNLRSLREMDPVDLPAMMAFAPQWPEKKEERWLLGVGVPDSNLLLGPGLGSPFAMSHAEHIGFLAGENPDLAAVLTWDKVIPPEGVSHFLMGDSFSAAVKDAKDAAAGTSGKRSALSKGFLDKVFKAKSAKEGGANPTASSGASATKGGSATAKEGDVEEVDDNAGSGKSEDEGKEPASAHANGTSGGAVNNASSGGPLVARPADLPVGQVMELKVTAPTKPGTYEMIVHLASDTWMGCDLRVPVTITVRDTAALERDVAAAQKAAEEEMARAAAKVEEEEAHLGEADDDSSSSDEEGREKADEYESDDFSDWDSDEGESEAPVEDKKKK